METNIAKLTPELLALFAGSDTTNALAPFTREVFILDITIAGTSYCPQMDEVFPQLQKDTVLKMQRDPNNQYDENAIGIYYQDVRIGWVPRTMNTIISRLMDAGKAFFCRVSNLNAQDNTTWKQIDCNIYMVE